MASIYLQPQDYAAYGASDATADQVQQASVLMDAHMQRPEGLVYVVDAGGQPNYMASASPELTLTAMEAISPGINVQVWVTGPVFSIQAGDVVVIDRISPEAAEAATVMSITGDPAGGWFVTLKAVHFNHDAAATMETGLVITEHKFLPGGRTVTVLSRAPVMRIVSGTGRYGYGRRGDAGNYNMDDFNLLATSLMFGGPPAWEVWEPNNAGVDPGSGQLWVPSGIMMAYYSEVKVRYVAGFTYESLPQSVKLACAHLVNSMQQASMLGNVKCYRAGETELQMFSPSNLSDDVKAMLQPWCVRAFG